MHVLRRFADALVPGGIMLDLQVIPPGPRVEVAGRVLCELDGSALLGDAEAASAAVDLLIGEGLLREEARDDHDVLRHFASGPALIEDYADRRAGVPAPAVPLLQTTADPCVVRERCRLRRFRTVHGSDVYTRGGS